MPQLDKFRKLLQELFQLDLADLDYPLSHNNWLSMKTFKTLVLDRQTHFAICIEKEAR